MDVSFRGFFEHSTIAELAPLVEKLILQKLAVEEP
jgi:hypothetical protein